MASAQEDKPGALMVDDLERSYFIHVPPGYDSAKPAPLVILLHGATMNGVQMMMLADFNTIADQTGAIVVYPDSLGERWIYIDEDEMPPDEAYHDDVRFIGALIDHLAEIYTIDTSRIYVAGYSSGGMLTLRLRCDMPGRFAGFAVIAANFSYDLALRCLDSDPAPVMVIMGTRDTAFPSLGYAFVTPDGQLDSLFSLNQEMSFLATLNQCDLSPLSEDVSAADGSKRVIRYTYGNCANNAGVVLYNVIEGDHNWPGYEIIDLGRGAEEDTIHDAIWEFFAAYGPPS
jgi:polyhydroxybutyrate depolymerase